MRRMTGCLLVGLALLTMRLPAGAQDKGDIKVDIVKYDGLKDAVARNRGKVVLVDFWGTL